MGRLNFNNIVDKAYGERVASASSFNMVGVPFNILTALRYDF